MRRTTQWAVFTSMNRQRPALRSLYEPAGRASSPELVGDTAEMPTSQPEPEPRSAPDTRRDRVELM
ncbi:MAG: hypothetical protein KFH98_11605 [Gemmatimonadetes bacterium]|nr:hypothetical protein [Gemmatimonadota bacterium]